MRIFRTLFFLACGVLVATSQAYAIDINREYNETFDAAPGMRLHLEHGDGDVSILPWAKDLVEIHVKYVGEIKKVGIGKVNTDFRVDFDVEGKTIYAKGHEPGGAIVFGFLAETDVDYRWTIKAPSYLLLELKGDDGDVAVSDWEADINAYLEDGDCSFDNIRGDLRMQLDDGDLTLDGFEGKLNIKGEDGDIVIRKCTSPDVRIYTDDGEILIDDASGNFEIESEDGDIELDQVEVGLLAIETDDGRVRCSELSGDSPEIDVHTEDGDVRLSFVGGSSYSFVVRHNDSPVHIDVGKIHDLKKDDGRVSGTVGAGRGQVRVRTDDGRVTFTGDDPRPQ